MEKIELKRTQELIQGALMNPFGAADTIEELVKPSKRLSPQQHFAIYQRSYIWRLRDCMANQFSALNFALGEDLFQQFADHYLGSFPSKSYTLNDLGYRFMDFLNETRPDKNAEKKESWPDFMIELAQFEYNLTEIFESYADEPKGKVLENTPDSDLVLIPVLATFEHQFPITWFYKEFVRENKPELPFPHKTYCLVSRIDFKLGLYEIREEQYHFLNFLRAGNSIAEAKLEMVNTFGVDAAKMDEIFSIWRSAWTEQGFFCLK